MIFLERRVDGGRFGFVCVAYMTSLEIGSILQIEEIADTR